MHISPPKCFIFSLFSWFLGFIRAVIYSIYCPVNGKSHVHYNANVGGCFILNFKVFCTFDISEHLDIIKYTTHIVLVKGGFNMIKHFGFKEKLLNAILPVTAVASCT